MLDVIIVGAGPVGSYSAFKLAASKHKVIVVERKAKIGLKSSCTGIIGKECASAFQIENELILRESNGATIFSPSGASLRLLRKVPQACILDRQAFDISLSNKAQGKGAEYLLNTEVKGIEIAPDKVVVDAARDGKSIRLESRAVVLASGFNRIFPERLGLGKVGDFVAGAQAEIKTLGIEGEEVYFGERIAPGFFAWVVPISPTTARIGLLSRRNPDMYLRNFLSFLASQGKIISSGYRMAYGAIPLRPLTKTYRERLLVVGDAAGQVKPTTGGGIYYGLLSADIAARVLNEALQEDDLSSRKLAQYEREWRKKLARELKIGYWARKVFERLNDRQIDRIIGSIKSSWLDRTLLDNEELSFDWHGKIALSLIGKLVSSKIIHPVKVPFTQGD